MRAITGAIVSSEPCSLAKAACILDRFSDAAASHLPSSDCAAYLRTAAEAASQHHLFRRDLRARLLQQGAAAASLDAHGRERPVDGDRKRQDREREGGPAAPAGGSYRDSAAKAELEVASGEGKGKKKVKREDLREDRAVADSPIPSSPVILIEKRKKEKRPDQETVVHVKLEPGLVVEEELGSEKQKRKKKKDHMKLEEGEEANVVGGKIVVVNDGAGEQVVSGGESKRKRKKHENAEKEEKLVADADMDTDEKRRKKRGRGDHDDHAIEQVEHTKKKQRKQS